MIGSDALPLSTAKMSKPTNFKISITANTLKTGIFEGIIGMNQEENSYQKQVFLMTKIEFSQIQLLEMFNILIFTSRIQI